jgi:transposase
VRSVPHEDNPGRRRQEVREYATRVPALLELADWLRCQSVQLVAMEATSSYGKPAFYLLEAEGFTCWLLNAKHVKNVPGRPKTDKLDAVWLAKVVERGMCRPSLVHPKPIRQLRDLTRYRRSLIRERTREKQRLEQLLEDAQIKLSSVISDLFGVSGRQLLQALIAGQRNPKALAQLARASMRSKIAVLEEALTGHFDDHHGCLCQLMLERIDAATAKIDRVTTEIDRVIAPFAHQVAQLDAITGVGVVAAQELIAEIGVEMGRFPTAAHLVSWAKFAPIDHQSAGTKKRGTTGRGNPWLAATLGEIVAALARTDTFLGERYRRLARRRGKHRAIVAVGNSVLTIVWHLLADPQARYQDLGPDFYASKINQRRRQRDLVRQLEYLTGKKVVLQPRPEQPAA